MVTITQEQALRRWDTLPESLKEALSSENSSITLWRACETEHVPPEKIYTIAKIAGWVLLGFLHPEEVAREIRDRLGINPEVAANISKALDSRIFSRIRNDLDKIYAPAGEEASYTAPKMMEEIRRTPEPTGQVVPSPASPLRSEASPIREPRETFEEKPIILHEEAEFEPGKPASGFKLETPPLKFDETGGKFTPPMRPARLEIGAKDEMKKIVNYSDLKTPIMSPERELPAASPPSLAEASRGGRGEPIQKKRRGFGGWLKSLFSRKPQKEIVFAPKVISEEELKREALTIKASMPASLRGEPKPPPTPMVPSGPAFGSRQAPTPKPPQQPQQAQPAPRPSRGPSVFEEVVDLSTFTKTQKPFPPPDDSNTVDLKQNNNAR